MVITTANDDNQKTHYLLKRKSKVDSDVFSKLSESDLNLIKAKNPFIKLLSGQELDSNVDLRYQLYDIIWQNQLEKINDILEGVNTTLFDQLNKFIHESIGTKLPIAYLQLSSNIANNIRILSQFNDYLSQKNTDSNYKFITLSSKYCANIKLSIREIVRQFVDDSSIMMGRQNYDISIVQDWYELQTEPVNIIITIQDTNSISSQVLNQIIKIINSKKNLKIKLIFGLSCSNISNWINNNINSDLKLLIQNFKFKSLDNSNLGFKILDSLFLTFKNEGELPLFLLDSNLSSILLNRFENSNNSIDTLISQIKLCYMIHFYQSPLSVLIESSFDLHDSKHKVYLSSLKNLESFKKFIELELYNKNYNRIKDCLNNYIPLIEEFNNGHLQFNKYKLTLINLINIIDIIQQVLGIEYKPKFTLYDLIINGKFLNSKYLSSIFKKLKETNHINQIINHIHFFLQSYQISIQINDDQTGENIVDTSLNNFVDSLPNISLGEDFFTSFQSYLNNDLLFKSIDGYLFHEIFTLNGGKLNQSTKLPENVENLMINLARPNYRLTIEQSLDNPKIYFKHEMISSENHSVYPTLTQLFSIYKNAPVNINIYDFFTTFKYSLNKLEIEKCLDQTFDEEEWNKVTYSWFIQNCHELMMLGFLKEKPKGDVLEKSTWIGV